MAAFKDLSPNQKRAYLKAHPNSRFGKGVKLPSREHVAFVANKVNQYMAGRRSHDRPTDTTIKTKSVRSRGHA